MNNNKQIPFSSLLNGFTNDIKKNRSANPVNLVLIIMANTHDHSLAESCEKDIAAIRKSFEAICKNAKMGYCEIEISGTNYTRENLWHTFDVVNHNTGQINVFYYTGHGFSYQNDKKRKYPQLDLRPHNDQPHFNKIDFIEKHTDNLAVVLEILRFGGGRINIAIADCCNTTVPFNRAKASNKEMNVVTGVMPAKIKELTKSLFNNKNNAICLLVSSSQHGVSSVSDPAIGSLFTHFFTGALDKVFSAVTQQNQYIPWHTILHKTSKHAFKSSQQYEADGGKPGHQEAVFEVFIDREE